LGQGSEFVVYLPLLETVEARVNAVDTLGAPASAGHQLLLIDDNADALVILSMLLKLKGYIVTTAASGLEGLQVAQTLQPAVILCDISMPDMDGYETCRRIRQHSWGKSMILISLTGYGQAQDIQRSLEAGFDKHLVKPVDVTMLGQLLADLTASN
jgi:CheY-like chemotaxis protein